MTPTFLLISRRVFVTTLALPIAASTAFSTTMRCLAYSNPDDDLKQVDLSNKMQARTSSVTGGSDQPLIGCSEGLAFLMIEEDMYGVSGM